MAQTTLVARSSLALAADLGVAPPVTWLGPSSLRRSLISAAIAARSIRPTRVVCAIMAATTLVARSSLAPAADLWGAPSLT
jgi:hypothetical protein